MIARVGTLMMKVRETRRKPRPVKVIKTTETRFEEPDTWGTKPWEAQTETQGKGKEELEEAKQ